MRLKGNKITLLDSSFVDAALAGFITSLASSRPKTQTLLLVDGNILGNLTENPSQALIKAWQRLVRQKFKALPPNLAGAKPVLCVTPALIGLAVILNNRIKLEGEFQASADARVDLHDRTLFDLLPAPQTVVDIFGFDLLVSAYSDLLREDSERTDLSRLQEDLLNLSPFTSLKSLDLILPYPLARLAPEYLPHWPPDKSVSERPEWWSLIDDILAHPGLVYCLHESWLNLPENRLSCLGLGLFLEELRNRGDYDALILRFFEAYEFLEKIAKTDPAAAKKPARFALLDLIESLLSAAGDGLSSRRLNQLGNEYFLKFRALLEIVAAQGRVPGEFRHLSHNFCFESLLPLVELATITGGRHSGQQSSVNFGRISFS